MVLLLRIRGVAGFDTIPRGLFKGLTIEAVRMTSPVYHSEVRLEADRWKMKMWPASFSTNSVVDASIKHPSFFSHFHLPDVIRSISSASGYFRFGVESLLLLLSSLLSVFQAW